MDATVRGLSRIMEPFRVAINAKGGDYWHAYMHSVIFINGKNNIDDGMLTGNNKNEPNLERLEDEKGRMCQVGTISLLGRRR
jgi:hypothetical protein